jgi:hypothetical protein
MNGSEMTNNQLAMLLLGLTLILGAFGWFFFIQYPAMYPHDRYTAVYDECERNHGAWFRWTESGRIDCRLGMLDFGQ